MENPTQLESAMQRVLATFYSFSSPKAEGARDSLSRRELKALILDQLADSIKAMRDTSYIDKIMVDLDENKDGQVDFQEFLTLVASLLMAFYHARQQRG